MIRKLITRLLNGKSRSVKTLGKRVEIGRAQHQIDASRLPNSALTVVRTLQQAGFEAYIVGGAVRDLLLGLKPKDFDVATNATPEQVKPLFRRAFLIGRRFRIVHVMFGREIIEVSTFRATLEAQTSPTVDGDERNTHELAGKHHAVDASGRVLRDNVWGPQDQDAARRDFTVNALYYDPTRDIVVDYHHGLRDLKARTLRMIGDPATRYREDPVRLLRVARFAAKLAFAIDPSTRAPIAEHAELLRNVPSARLFDETIKLLQTGHALASLEQLRRLGLHAGLLPLIDLALSQPQGEAFVMAALRDTDARIAEGKTASPSFLFACLLWPQVNSEWVALQAEGLPAIAALDQAADAVLSAQAERLAIQRRISVDMREIWSLQPRLARRTPRYVHSALEHPRFRAAFDFLLLRAQTGDADPELASWWESFQEADDAARAELIERAGRASPDPAKRKRRRRKKPAADGGEVKPAEPDATP
ncbi:MAG: polynucleotide adenylyltransferase PcnB [Betaproteobacteria bacterium]|jgi:poly(A) polymerase|uniref:polynucleotide adenylyltransferase PcnB n=1 Tax=Thiomonas sp. TaxID=2047785 RepID=UPI000BC49A3A|nr:polynucleotide adenylyltransferase PcnB [Thiomonas sp.]MDE2128162.1 polynucleotide adenylyltransferase PcnB [Betaproteobacteria bacterium]OZB43902.1 MAG: poly(A) polymerase [Thiomonas sp. 15-66-11]OZB65929.1 MAG: poly(A) polymerase [Thiomonas sp. 13-66-29]